MVSNIYIIASIFFIVAMFLFTIFLWFRSRKSKIIKSFAWLGVSALLWMILDLATSFTFFNQLQSILIWRIGFIAAFIFSLVNLRFVFIFLGRSINKFWAILIALSWFLISGLILFTNALIKDVTVLEFSGQSNYLIGDFFYLIILAILTPLFLAFVYTIIEFLKEKKIIRKKQIGYILLGLSFPVIITPTTNLFFPLMKINFPKLAHVSVFIGMLFFLMAIYKNKFLGLTIKRFKIKTNIILPIMITAVIVLSVATFYSYSFNVRTIKTAVSLHLETAITSRAHHLETVLKVYEQRARLMTSKTWLRKYLKSYLETGDKDYKIKIEEILADIQLENSKFLHISIINSSGQTIISSDQRFVGEDISDKDFFIKGKTIYTLSDFHQPEFDGSRLHIAGPLVQDGEFLGVIVVGSDGKTLEGAVVEYVALGESGEIYLINQDAYMITPSRFREDTFLKERIYTSQASLCLKEHISGNSEAEMKETMELYLDYRGEEVFGMHTYIPEMQWCLLAEIDKSEALAPTKDLLKFSLMRVSMVLLLFLIVAYLLGRAISKPIIALRQGVEIIEKGDLNHRVGTDSQDEIGDLSRAFDKMTLNIKKSRLEIDQKVEEQTKEIQEKQKYMADQQMAVLNILEDVEEEKDKTKIIARDLEKFKLAVDNASDHIVITDAEGIVLYANQAVEEITGYSNKETVGEKAGFKDNWGGLMDLKFYQKMWKTIKENKKVFSGDIKNKRKNGEEYDAAASISPILNQDQEVAFFIGIERDITREKAIDQAKTEFVSLASHQLRTPLSAINWYTEMLLNGDAGKISKEQKDYLQEIYTGNQRMVILVNSLLNVSRLELGTFMVKPELTDISKLADLVVKELQPKIKERNIKFTKKYSSQLPKVKIDQQLITMIFQNLLSNAVKYTPAKGKVNLSIEKKSKSFIIKVEDSGYGIPKHQQNKMFSKLFRADNIREKDTEGTGLGLYIIKSIVDNAKGKIWFESKLNKGTTFYVKMPLSGMKAKEGSRKLS
jgi:PAS domain S-box-containing protein